MAELLPTLQARTIRQSITDYLTTTFALTEPAASAALSTFLTHPERGLFKGPFLRLRLPFRAADPGWENTLDITPMFPPYGHQAAAFARLSTKNLSNGQNPQPTLVTTGTGSGKTEAFLYPILDHVRRAKVAGETGTKALILYPMNALANDQATRITHLISTINGLAGVTVGLYTGQGQDATGELSAGDLITDRYSIRNNPPDILLTNYKMLDQLLLRPEDQELWKRSATSLQYIVLDEFHTYDGAQGTDVAMLLRRLGLALTHHWTTDNDTPGSTQTSGVAANPLGKLTPVATSATLGDKGDPTRMLDFAHTVFGVKFDDNAVVTESRIPLTEWHQPGPVTLTNGHTAHARAVNDIDQWALLDDLSAYTASQEHNDDTYTLHLTARVLTHLFTLTRPADHTHENPLTTHEQIAIYTQATPADLLRLEQSHPLIAQLVTHSEQAESLTTLAHTVLPRPPIRGTDTATRRTRDHIYTRDPRTDILDYITAALSTIRARAGRNALTIELHMWVRELSRIDRMVAIRPAFRWYDDGILQADDIDDHTGYTLPAIYCRHCGRSGWQILLAPTGTDLDPNDNTIRTNALINNNRIRPLMYAQREADQADNGEPVPNLHWFHTDTRTLDTTAPQPDNPKVLDGVILPVLTYTDLEANDKSTSSTCPNCDRKDGIRPLGSRIATLLSVTLSTMFGEHYVDTAEKKALIFTDSVQDAAHRAGFVQARSHALTLRAVLNSAITTTEQTLPELVDTILNNAEHSTHDRYKLVPPDCTDRPQFAAYWNTPTGTTPPKTARTAVRTRLLFDTLLEFGLQHTLGRTLELTGTAHTAFRLPEETSLLNIGRIALDGYGQTSTLTEATTEDVFTNERIIRWITGILERMRADGAIHHPWLDTYLHNDGMRIWIWGKRPKDKGMPAFPKGRSGFGFPRAGTPLKGTGESDFTSINNPQGWYATWTARTLRIENHTAANLTAKLFRELAKHGVLTHTTSTSGGYIYALSPHQIVVRTTTETDLTNQPLATRCTVCQALTPGNPHTVTALAGGPCLMMRCPGTLTASHLDDNFYRTLYRTADMRRIIAREHSSLLDDTTRLAYETGFKTASQRAGDPNVLVATPTLEMGIDIGDLSSVLLASMPRSVASYIQRVGRAGRQTGNALNLAYVKGRGNDLARLDNPLSVINGSVRAPATYLSAEEILRRQYFASVLDQMARTRAITMPRQAAKVFATTSPNTPFLSAVIGYAETHSEELLNQFLGQFNSDAIAHFSDAATHLRTWARPHNNVESSSNLAEDVYRAQQRWNARKDALTHRLTTIDQVYPEIQHKTKLVTATEADHTALASLKGEKYLLQTQLTDLREQYWIAALEEYGLLPNYTLLDDSVDLDITVRWRNPESNDYESDELTLTRSASNAIREFVPGAHFYARGYHTRIQAIDLGSHSSDVIDRAFCNKCGYSEQVLHGAQRSASCPRCGSPGIGDTGQILRVVELTRVSSEISRDESLISDSTDDRERPAFTVRAIADIDTSGDNVATQWFLKDHEFGVRYLRRLTLTELNLGKTRQNAIEIELAGNTERTPLFSVCEYCGKLDSSTNHNTTRDHRAWCVYRTDPDEHNVQIAISRTLHTQGLVMRLPVSFTAADDTAIPSLIAAVRVGLREYIGGDPDHLGVLETVDPHLADGTKNRRALLIHDLVPGGTGYLADVADPQQLRMILWHAYQVLATCDCDPTLIMACANCLLPYADPHTAHRVSRDTAQRFLRELLNETTDTHEEDAPDPHAQWQVTNEVTVNQSFDSYLEALFRKKFADMITTRGGTVNSVHSPGGTQLNFSLTNATVTWKLRPQVPLGHTTPDFLLEATNPHIPKVAIYTDGYTYHATHTHNNLADDAHKRNTLREQGYIVVAVTADDLDDTPHGGYAPTWFQQHEFATLGAVVGAESAEYTAINAGVLSMLWYYINAAQERALNGASKAARVMWLRAPESATKTAVTIANIYQLASRIGQHTITTDILDEALNNTATGPGQHNITVMSHDNVLHLNIFQAVAGGTFTSHTVLVLDDSEEAVNSTGHKTAWQSWLRTANMLNWGTDKLELFTTTMLAEQPHTAAHQQQATITSTSGVSLAQPHSASAIVNNWKLASLQLSEAEYALLEQLAAELAEDSSLSNTLQQTLDVGHETADGIPIDLAWPNYNIGVIIQAEENDITQLADAGWTILTGDTTATELAHTLRAALAETGNP